MLINRITKTEAEVRLYGNIGNWFANADNFTSVLVELQKEGCTEITLRMHCYGGSVFDGNVIGNAISRIQGLKIQIDGIAASMACFLLPYVTAANISISANGFGMIHRPWGSAEGDADDLRSNAKLMEDMEANFISNLTSRTGLSAEEIKKKWFDGKDHWLNAKEMLQYKLAGRIVDSIADVAELDEKILSGMKEDVVYGHFSAKLNTLNKQTLMNKTTLIATFGLQGVTEQSTDAELLASLQLHYKTIQDKVNRLEAEAKEKAASEIKAILDNSPTVTDENRKIFQEIGEKNGIQALSLVLASAGDAKKAESVTTIASIIKGGSALSDTTKDWDWYQKNNVEALEAMEKNSKPAFNELYKKKYGVSPSE